MDGSVTVTLGYDPAFAFPRIIAVGDTATLTTQVSVNGTAAGEGSFTYKLLGAEPVTVKAGTFAGCLKFEMQITIPGTADQHFSLWFAPGIGIVKQDSRPFGGTDWSELVAASLGGVIIPTQSQLVTDYWPFAQGNTWTSQWTGGGGSYTQTETVNGTVVISGKTYFRLVYSDGDQDFFLADADGIHMGGSLKSGQQSTAVPPLTIPNGLQVGQPVLETSTIYVGNASQGTMTLKVTLLGTETVFAPAGVFPFCKKIELRMRQPGETADKVITTWYAEKVGPVKEHEVKADSTVEDSVLQSATVGGVHYPQ